MLIARSCAIEFTRISRIPVSIIETDNVRDRSREVEGNMIELDVVCILPFCRSRSIVFIESQAT